MSATSGKYSSLVVHNLLWPKYKGAIFSELSLIEAEAGNQIAFLQLAETERSRRAIAAVDRSYHLYAYSILSDGDYEDLSIRRLINGFFQALSSSRPDLIVLPGYHRPEHWLMLGIAAFQRKKICVFCDSTARDNPKKSFLKSTAKKFFFGRMDGIFAYGTRSREYLEGYGVDPKIIFDGCQAAALPHDYSESSALIAREKTRSITNPLRLLYVGRLSPEKGLSMLMEALIGFEPEGNTFELRIVGAGPQLQDLLRAARQLPNGAVVFLGSLAPSELSEEYSRASCLVLPSLSEPWGLVVNEALSYGCPAIVSDACGCAVDLIVEGVTGLTFASNDINSLRVAIRRFLATSARYRAKECISFVARFSPQFAASRIHAGMECVMRSAEESK